jgi:acetyltransferase-like isoleucine patch superfamily enzyme
MHNILRFVWALWKNSKERVCFPLWRTWARLWGAQVHESVIFSGRPLVRVTRGSSLILRQGVVVHSAVSANPLIGRRVSTLSTLAPDAVLELGLDVGVSGVCICAAREIRIGEGTIIGADTSIFDNDFHLPLPNWRWSNGAVESARPVKIGRGCFIGTRAIILKGVTLGDGAVVGAGAVVTQDVPSGYMAYGNPAQIRPLSAQWKR